MTNGQFEYDKLINEEYAKIDELEDLKEQCLDSITKIVEYIKAANDEIATRKEIIEKLKALSK